MFELLTWELVKVPKIFSLSSVRKGCQEISQILFYLRFNMSYSLLASFPDSWLLPVSFHPTHIHHPKASFCTHLDSRIRSGSLFLPNQIQVSKFSYSSSRPPIPGPCPTCVAKHPRPTVFFFFNSPTPSSAFCLLLYLPHTMFIHFLSAFIA